MKDWQDPSTEAALLGGGLAAVLGAAPGVDAEHCLRLLHEPGALTAALNWYRAQSAADLDGLARSRPAPCTSGPTPIPPWVPP
jgi:hypothetical protein